MHSSVSSTLVTVWAFKRNCFLIKVSMSTSVRSFRIPWSETRNYLDTGVPFKLPPGCNFNSSKRLNAHYTFRRRTRYPMTKTSAQQTLPHADAFDLKSFVDECES